MSEDRELTKLEALQAERDRKKAEFKAARDAQELIDLEAIMQLESEHGDESMVVLDVPFTPGFPVKIAARLPLPQEIKRYRARVKVKDPDAVGAAEEVADVTLIYPNKDVFDKMCALRNGIKSPLGVAALKLASAKSESEGKD